MMRFIAGLMLLALAVGCQPEQISLNSDLKIGSTFPDLSGEDIHSHPISMAEFKGKVVLVDFFGDW